MIGEFIRLTAIILVMSVLVVLLHSRLAEYSFLLVLAVVCSAILLVINTIFPQIQTLKSLFEKSGNAGIYFGVALKALGISYITDFAGGVALVIGSEGKGVSRLVREKSDFIVSLPMRGKINSLNASVAAGILMYEVAKQRLN